MGGIEYDPYDDVRIVDRRLIPSGVIKFPDNPNKLDLAAMPVRSGNGNGEYLMERDNRKLRLTADIGIRVEKELLKFMSGNKEIDHSVMRDLKFNTDVVLASISYDGLNRAPNSTELAILFMHILGPVTVISFVGNRLVHLDEVSYPAMRNLMKDVDCVFKTNFDAVMQRRVEYFDFAQKQYKNSEEIVDYDIVSDMSNREAVMRRYLLEGTLCLAKSVISPIDLVRDDQWLIPDVRLKPEGKTLVQIDAAIAQKDAISKTAKWLLTGKQTLMPEEGFWEAVEVKTLFSPVYTFHADRPKAILKNHVRQFKHKLATLFLNIPNFLPPKKVSFIYPHGVQDTVVRSANLDDTFYGSWQKDIKKVLEEDTAKEHLRPELGRLYFEIQKARERLAQSS